MQQPIGFTWQQYADGACGKVALQHALLLLGIPVSRKAIEKATGIHPLLTRAIGTSSERLKRGIRHFGCKPFERMFHGAERMKKEVDALLEKGCPTIIAVEENDHWAVISGKYSKAEYFWIDSADDKLIDHWGWEKIVDWIDSDEYYMLGIVPRDERRLRHSIVPIFRKVCKDLRDDDLREYWGYYLEDLLESFDCPADASDTVSANVFFNLYGKMLLDACCYWYIDADEDKMRWELENYRRVAIAHRLTVSKNKIPEAIANLSAALAVIACTE